MFRKNKSENTGTTIYTKGSKIPAILVVAIIVLSVIIGLKLGSDWQKAKGNKKNHITAITSDALHQEIEQIGELATVNYYYTNMGKFEDAVKLLDLKVPFTTKSFVLSYDGQIKAGVDLSKVKISVDRKIIQVTIPMAYITSHEVDMDSVTLFDEKNSVFNGLSAADVTEFVGGQKKIMEDKAVNNDLLVKAQENARELIKALLNNFVKTYDTENEYEMQFVLEESESKDETDTNATKQEQNTQTNEN